MHHESTNNFFNDLVKFLTIFFKYKWMILIVFFTISVISIFMIKRIPTVYEAKATILVKLGHEFMYRSETPQGGTQRLMSQEEALNNEIKILANKDLIKKVIATIGISNLYPKMVKDSSPASKTQLEVAAMKFEAYLSALPIKNSNIIEVSFKHEDPAMAARALNILVEQYKDKHIDVYSDPKSSFLEEQTATFSDKLKQVEDKLQSFKQKNQVYSLDEQRSALLQQRISMDTTLRTTQTQMREIEQRITFVKSPAWNTDAILASKAQLRTLQQKERELLERYTPTSRMVQSARKEIQAVEESIVGPLEDARRIELSKLEGELGALKAKADGLQRQMGQLSGAVHALDSREKEYLNLKRDFGSQESSYKAYLVKLEESRIVDDMNKKKLSNVSVIQNATMPLKPAESKKRQYALLSLILAVGVGFGLAYLRELVPQRLATPLAAEKHLGLPVMVSIALKK
jgi:polysaccharide biosynthesis protein PslE